MLLLDNFFLKLMSSESHVLFSIILNLNTLDIRLHFVGIKNQKNQLHISRVKFRKPLEVGTICELRI